MLLFPLLLLLAGTGCSPDLREAVGPVQPIPNLTGRVVRSGVPLGNVKVRLNETITDSTVAQDRTTPDGRFGFVGVGPGDWTVKTSGNQPGDFARVSWEFAVLSADSALESPDLDVDPAGLQLDSPADGDTLDFPGFSTPVTFRWTGPAREGSRVQARVFDAADSAVFYSDKMHTTQVSWNGLANLGRGAGHPVASGDYTWELRVDTPGNLEYTTATRRFVLRERRP